MATPSVPAVPSFANAVQAASRLQPAFRYPGMVEALRRATPARIGVGAVGPRPLTRELLSFRAAHASAQDAVQAEIGEDWLAELAPALSLRTRADSKREYLLRPDLGRRLDATSETRLREAGEFHRTPVLLLLGDGLSAEALPANAAKLLPSLRAALARRHLEVSEPIFIRHARVGVMDHVGAIAQPEIVILLIGERPGLQTAESLSAYLCFRPRLGSVDAERNVVSNIHRHGGLDPNEAGPVIADIAAAYAQHHCSGVKLALVRGEQPEATVELPVREPAPVANEASA